MLTATDTFSSKPVVEIDRVMIELDHFRRQTERLDLINKLHIRLAAVLDLAGMIEAFSVWLMPHVEHELIGYNNTIRSKKHLFCSGHGPLRRSVIAFAEQLMEDKAHNVTCCVSEDGHYAHKWLMEAVDNAGLLLVLKGGRALRTEEIDLINESLLVLSESLRRALEYEELFESARRDALTGLANRRVFDEQIKSKMDSARRSGRPLTMASMDLDRFKQINDNLGHQRGDQVLRQVAAVMAEAVRSTDLLVRMGGDEFLLVMDDTDQKNSRILAERLCLAIDELDVWADSETKLGVSIGLAQWEKDESLEVWMERVDDILYHAKANGRSRVSLV
ncbi:MAG: GGDEF domain-containing protein [Proteobacteria bacterium]|nr:GGDEF domain-containing protein [Pseudomonadota bacterium]MBU1649159.1 GGDEF domain-containing protein [Pseudomonadota bacterium]MBU1986598.1 GGDEF domain-containing protein [Pseudomonadota bacterium]